MEVHINVVVDMGMKEMQSYKLSRNLRVCR